MRTKELYNLDRLELTEENKDTIKFIRNCKQYCWPPWSSEPKTKHGCLVEISRRLFVPLCCKSESVMLDKTYGNRLKPCDAGIKSTSIGIGSFATWHGSPDARIRGTEVVCVTEDETDSDVEETKVENAELEENYDSDGSYETTTTVEAKKQFKQSDLPQLVATCVTSSFTENKLHVDLPSAVPTILIDPTGFRVCFYDCKRDLLLISERKSIKASKQDRMSRSAVLFLWLTINHR